MSGLESGLFQPMAAQSNSRFDLVSGKIANRFDFKRASFCVLSFRLTFQLRISENKVRRFLGLRSCLHNQCLVVAQLFEPALEIRR